MLLTITFYFNDTPTTEIYTHCHTLFLHDPLPIYQLRLWPGLFSAGGAGRRRSRDQYANQAHLGATSRGRSRRAHFRQSRYPRHLPVGAALCRSRPDRASCARLGARSEEHTSDLQSIMRTWYAVSCFNKKNTITSQ